MKPRHGADGEIRPECCLVYRIPSRVATPCFQILLLGGLLACSALCCSKGDAVDRTTAGRWKSYNGEGDVLSELEASIESLLIAYSSLCVAIERGDANHKAYADYDVLRCIGELQKTHKTHLERQSVAALADMPSLRPWFALARTRSIPDRLETSVGLLLDGWASGLGNAVSRAECSAELSRLYSMDRNTTEGLRWFGEAFRASIGHIKLLGTFSHFEVLYLVQILSEARSEMRLAGLLDDRIRQDLEDHAWSDEDKRLWVEVVTCDQQDEHAIPWRLRAVDLKFHPRVSGFLERLVSKNSTQSRAVLPSEDLARGRTESGDRVPR